MLLAYVGNAFVAMANGSDCIVQMESECLTVISLPYRTQYGSIIKNEIPRNAHSYSIKKVVV